MKKNFLFLSLVLLMSLNTKCPPKLIVARRTDPATSPGYPKAPTPPPLEPTPAEVAAFDAARAAEKERRRELKLEIARTAQTLSRIADNSQSAAAAIAELTEPELATWVETSLFQLPKPAPGWTTDRDIKLALDADETANLLNPILSERVRTIRRLLRALDLTSRKGHDHWSEEATIQCVERINEGKLELARDEADVISRRIKECQNQHEKELAVFEREKRKTIFLLSRACDILRTAAKLNPIDDSRESVSTPRRLTNTMYKHQVYKDESHLEDAGPALE